MFGYSTRSVHSGNKGNKEYKGNVHQGNNGLTLKGEQRPSTKGTRQAWSACAGHVHQALPGRVLDGKSGSTALPERKRKLVVRSPPRALGLGVWVTWREKP